MALRGVPVLCHPLCDLEPVRTPRRTQDKLVEERTSVDLRCPVGSAAPTAHRCRRSRSRCPLRPADRSSTAVPRRSTAAARPAVAGRCESAAPAPACRTARRRSTSRRSGNPGSRRRSDAVPGQRNQFVNRPDELGLRPVYATVRRPVGPLHPAVGIPGLDRPPSRRRRIAHLEAQFLERAVLAAVPRPQPTPSPEPARTTDFATDPAFQLPARQARRPLTVRRGRTRRVTARRPNPLHSLGDGRRPGPVPRQRAATRPHRGDPPTASRGIRPPLTRVGPRHHQCSRRTARRRR